jgi:hypothetical protein
MRARKVDAGNVAWPLFVNSRMVVSDVDALEESSRSDFLRLGKLTLHQCTLQDFAQPNTTPVGSGYLLVCIFDTASSTGVRVYAAEKHCHASIVLRGHFSSIPSTVETEHQWIWEA